MPHKSVVISIFMATVYCGGLNEPRGGLFIVHSSYLLFQMQYTNQLVPGFFQQKSLPQNL